MTQGIQLGTLLSMYNTLIYIKKYNAQRTQTKKCVHGLIKLDRICKPNEKKNHTNDVQFITFLAAMALYGSFFLMNCRAWLVRYLAHLNYSTRALKMIAHAFLMFLCFYGAIDIRFHRRLVFYLYNEQMRTVIYCTYCIYVQECMQGKCMWMMRINFGDFILGSFQIYRDKPYEDVDDGCVCVS